MRRAIGALVALTCCRDLARFELGICGNAVLERGEDCDTFVDPTLGADLRCGEVGGACRYLCIQGAKCPANWACGPEGACHQPSPCFHGTGVHSVLPAFSQVVLRDVDGDARSDLIVRKEGEITVLLGQSDGRFVAAFDTVVEDPRGPFSVSDLDADGRPELLVPVMSSPFPEDALPGVQILELGLGGFEPRAFATREFYNANYEVSLVPLTGSRAARRHQRLVAYSSFEGMRGWRYGFELAADACADPSATVRQTRAELEAPSPELSVPRVFAVGAGHFAITGEDAIAVATSSIARIFAIREECSPDVCGAVFPSFPSCTERLVETATISAPAETRIVESRVFLQSRDGGDPELFAVAHPRIDGSGHAWALYFASASHGFRSFERDPRTGALRDFSEGATCLDPELSILTIDDFDGDGRADFVTPQRVVLATDASELKTAAIRVHGDLWIDAQTGDFDGDGRTDVAAIVARDQAACLPIGVDILINDGLGGFATRQISNLVAPRALAIGDFDGDGFDDLAIADELSGGTFVTIDYGAPSTPLTARAEVGSFDRFFGLSAVAPARSGPNGAGRDFDLVISTGDRIAIARASPIRVPSAPLWFTNRRGSGGGFLRVIGGLSAQRGPTPLVPDPYRSIVAFGERVGWKIDLNPFAGLIVQPLADSAPEFSCGHVSLAEGTRERPGIFLATDKTEHAAGASPGGPEACSALPLDRAPQIFVFQLVEGGSRAIAAIGGPCSFVRSEALGDFDADGALDAMFTLGRGSEDPACGPELVSIAWKIGLTGMVTSSLPRFTSLGEGLQAAVPIDVDGDAELELALWEKDRGVSLVDLDTRAGTSTAAVFVSMPVARSVIETLPAPRPGERVYLFAGDVDGDGLQDLVEAGDLEAVVHPAYSRDVAAGLAECPQ